jgi:hypothetical protein
MTDLHIVVPRWPILEMAVNGPAASMNIGPISLLTSATTPEAVSEARVSGVFTS